MSTSRRDFLKLAGLTGLGTLGATVLPSCRSQAKQGDQTSLSQIRQHALQEHPQRFNMSGYAAPALPTVRAGFIGLGRGLTHVNALSKIQGVDITALCDLQPARVDRAVERIAGTPHQPDRYSGDPEAWKRMCDRDDLDVVYIATPWDLHVPMALYAMEQGKHAFVEVPAATTVEGCWQLVETSERTRRHCMMLENTCYDFFELLTLNMARQGFFGEIIHAEGAYIHNLLELNFSKEGYWNMWRLKQNAARNGNLYPTHGLGPVSQVMNLNRGDKMEYLVSMSSDDFMMGKRTRQLAAEDDFYKPYVGRDYRGNMNTTTIRTAKGRTIMLQHDVTSPRPYSRIHLISGTKGVARKWPLPGRIATGHEWMPEEEMEALQEEYTPPIVERIGELAKQVEGHGGMDFMMNWRVIDCLRNGLPLDQDVYDAALWSVVAPLSEWSVANRSQSIDVPDFTNGAWETNQPVDIQLEKGGNTEVRI